MTAESVSQLLARAANAAEQGNIEEGIDLYRRVLELRPDDSIARNNLGCLLIEAREVDEAVQILEQYDGEGTPELRANLGYALLSQGELHQSEKLLRTILEHDPEDEDARLHLGMVLLRRGETNDAIDEFRRVAREHPNKAEAWNNLGCALHRRGQISEAQEMLERALRIDPYHVDAHNNFGCVLRDQGMVEGAVEELQLAVGLEPRNPMIHLNLSMCFRQLGKPRSALSHLRRHLRYSEQRDDVSNMHRLLRELEAQVEVSKDES